MSDLTALASGGRALWKAINAEHELDAGQKAQLLEACRAKDRLDALDVVIRAHGEGWDELLNKANTTANLMKQLIAAIRLPDRETGRRPQHRSARGSQRPDVPRGSVSLVDRLRAG